MNFQAYNKAIAAFIAGVIIVGLKQLNFPVDQGVQDALGILVLSVVVWAIPNKK